MIYESKATWFMWPIRVRFNESSEPFYICICESCIMWLYKASGDDQNSSGSVNFLPVRLATLYIAATCFVFNFTFIIIWLTDFYKKLNFQNPFLSYRVFLFFISFFFRNWSQPSRFLGGSFLSTKWPSWWPLNSLSRFLCAKSFRITSAWTKLDQQPRDQILS